MSGTNPNVKKASPAKRKEWLEFFPEIVDAIRSGFLDDVLGPLQSESETRYELVKHYGYYSVPVKKPVRKVTRKKVSR